MATSAPIHMRDLPSHRCRLLLTLLACVMLLVGQIASAQAAYGQSVQAPELIADEFYGWYLKTLASDEDPFAAKREKLATYVSKDLITEIARQINSVDGVSEDYFLKAQDYLDEWHSARRASKPVRHGAISILLITLGTKPENIRTVELSMILENGAWKIRRVKLKD